MPRIVAHRGFSSRHPEMTRAAYEAALAWSAQTGIPLGLECDVHFSADDQLICLHDLSVDRTAGVPGEAIDLTLAQLKQLNVGAAWRRDTTAAEQELLSLEELLIMVRDARAAGTDVTLVIETKHPNPRGGDVEHRVATVLSSYGWDRAGSPVRVISFSAEAMERLRVRLPAVERSFLVEGDLGPWRDGDLPDGVQIVGVDIRLLEQDPGFVARAQARGHQVDAWTVHEPAEITLAQSLGVATFTTDWPDRVAQALALSPG